MFVSRDIFNDEDDQGDNNYDYQNQGSDQDNKSDKASDDHNNYQQKIQDANGEDDDWDSHWDNAKSKEKQYEAREEPMKLDAFVNNSSDSEGEEQNNDWNKPTYEDLKKPTQSRDNNDLGSKHTAYEDKTNGKNLNSFLYDAGSSRKQNNDDDWPSEKASTKNNFDDLYSNSSKTNVDSTDISGNRPGTGQMNARARLQQQQKQRLQTAKGTPIDGIYAPNDMLGKKKDDVFGYQPASKNDDDFANLMQYQNSNNMVYDPTFKSGNKSNLPSLSKTSNLISYKVEEHEHNPQQYQPKRDEERAHEQQYQYEEIKEAETTNAQESSDEDETPTPSAGSNKETAKQMEEKRNELQKQPDAEIAVQHPTPQNRQQNNVDQPPVQETKILAIDLKEISDMKAFLMRPCPKGVQIQCTIKRDRSGFNRFYPKYHCYLSHGPQYLMSGKKRSANRTSNYLIAYKKDEMKKNSLYFLGKVRSNFMGTEFNIFDHGQNPKKCHDPSLVRENLGVVIYESNLLGARGPRKMKVLVPEVKSTGEIFQFKPMNPKEGIMNNMKNNRLDGIKIMFNKPPKWNDQVQAYVLNFNGRVEKPSVKNFQLIDEHDEDRIYMQFGRVSNDTFNMDFEWPLSPYQAFAICLSSFDYKIACE